MILITLLIMSLGINSFAASDTSDIITDIVFNYKTQGLKAYGEIQTLLRELKEKDEKLFEIWKTIMQYWIYSNTDQSANEGELPDGLADDDSLCIVTMGFQLNDDGTMQEELKNRLDVALRCHEKYPNAYFAVTGGGTAKKTVKATEADVMAKYLEENGIEADKIIIENTSITTAENVLNLGPLILENYPSITSLAIVTSDYHVPESAMLFREYMYLASKVGGNREIQVVSNAAYMANTPEFADTLIEQSPYVWSIAETFGVTK